jgi:hypothetical protein
MVLFMVCCRGIRVNSSKVIRTGTVPDRLTYDNHSSIQPKQKQPKTMHTTITMNLVFPFELDDGDSSVPVASAAN